MESRIKTYLDSLFSQVPDSQKAREVKQEMLQNLSEKYTDLLAEGKAPEAAYQLTIDSIGDVSGLIAELSMERGIGYTQTDSYRSGNSSFTQTDPFAKGNDTYSKTDSYTAPKENQTSQTGSTSQNYGGTSYTNTGAGQADPYTTGNSQTEQSKGLPAWAIAAICIVVCCFVGWFAVRGITRILAIRNAANAIRQVEDYGFSSILEELYDELEDEGISINLSEGDELETTGEAFLPGEINRVEVRWVSGDITIQSGSAVEFSIVSEHALSDGEEACYEIRGKTLIINEYRSTRSVDFGLNLSTLSDFGKKSLTLTLPEGLDDLEIDVVSASISFADPVFIEEIKINSVSSNVTATGISCDDLEINSVSGDVTIQLVTMPEEITFNCISGSLNLTVPQDVKGFEVTLDSMSGSLYCKGFDFSGGRSFTYGDGKAKVKCDTMSGSVTIIKEGSN